MLMDAQWPSSAPTSRQSELFSWTRPSARFLTSFSSKVETLSSPKRGAHNSNPANFAIQTPTRHCQHDMSRSMRRRSSSKKDSPYSQTPHNLFRLVPPAEASENQSRLKQWLSSKDLPLLKKDSGIKNKDQELRTPSLDSLSTLESSHSTQNSNAECYNDLEYAIKDLSDSERQQVHSLVNSIATNHRQRQWKFRKRDALLVLVSLALTAIWIVCFVLVLNEDPWLDRNPFAWRVGRFLPSYAVLYATTMGFTYALPKCAWWRRCLDTKLSRLCWHFMLNLIISFIAIAVFWIDFWGSWEARREKRD